MRVYVPATRWRLDAHDTTARAARSNSTSPPAPPASAPRSTQPARSCTCATWTRAVDTWIRGAIVCPRHVDTWWARGHVVDVGRCGHIVNRWVYRRTNAALDGAHSAESDGMGAPRAASTYRRSERHVPVNSNACMIDARIEYAVRVPMHLVARHDALFERVAEVTWPLGGQIRRQRHATLHAVIRSDHASQECARIAGRRPRPAYLDRAGRTCK